VLPPLGGLAKGVLVADDHQGAHLVRHWREATMWVGTQEQSDAPPAQTRREIVEAFDEKPVMPEVRTHDERVMPRKTTTGFSSRLRGSIATSSAGLSAARCARCIQ